MNHFSSIQFTLAKKIKNPLTVNKAVYRKYTLFTLCLYFAGNNKSVCTEQNWHFEHVTFKCIRLAKCAL